MVPIVNKTVLGHILLISLKSHGITGGCDHVALPCLYMVQW